MSQRIFITGGASGLGKAVALRYAKAGARVCIADINAERAEEALTEIKKYAADAFYIHCNVQEYENLETARDKLVERWDGVDIVVNNAGVATAGFIEDNSVEDWKWVIDINLLSVVYGCKAFTPLFKTQGHGHFVNTASMAGIALAPGMSSYNVTKAAVIALSETLRYELGARNIGVTVVCPSFFQTNLTDSMRSTMDGINNMVSKFMKNSKVSADDIADDIYNAVAKKKFWLLPHNDGKMINFVKKYVNPVYGYFVAKETKRLIKRFG